MNKNSNTYIIAYAAVMVVIVAAVLSFAALSLKGVQAENARVEKMGDILRSIGEGGDADLAKDKAAYINEQYKKYIVDSYAVNVEGDRVEGANAFALLTNLKAEYDKIFKNEIITDLLKVLGCGVEVQDKRAKDLASFDLNSLRWNKIVICTDADVDGYQIRTLILTMLWRLTPTLIQEGYVYIAESPLYEITAGGKTWFAYSEKEKADILGQISSKKPLIQRSKGLGENDPEMMALTTMSPATRRLIKVMPEDVERTAYFFDLLLGDDLQGRKSHIADNGYKYLELADIS